MRASEAVEIVRNSVFKPGWRMEAESYGQELLMFTFYIDTVDTSYPDADGVCRKHVTLIRDDMIDVSQLRTAGDLFLRILGLAAETDVHENREFLKIRQADGSWKAPLHPHTAEGERAWMKDKLTGVFR
jgi:hypothetical protein